MKQTELNKITDLLEKGDYSLAIWKILMADMDSVERTRIHKELVTELQCNGYMAYKPDNIISEGQINSLIQSIIPDYQKCNPPLIF